MRAASRPVRSSRGSGSAYPSSTASRTACENGLPADTADITYISVPLTDPSIRSTRSPVSTSLWKVSMIGRPAPDGRLVAHDPARLARRCRAGARSSAHEPASGFLFARTMSKPWPTAARSRSSVSSLVTSTMHRPRHGVPGHLVSASAADGGLAAERRQECARILLARQLQQPPAREAARLEHVARAIEQSDHAHGRLPVRSARPSDRRAHGPPGRTRGTRRRCAARRAGRRRRSSTAGTPRGRGAPPRPPASAGHGERDVPLRRALRDRDDVDAAAEASAENTRAAMPGLPAMPSPTTAITAMPGRAVTLSMRPLAELVAERVSQAARPRAPRPTPPA